MSEGSKDSNHNHCGSTFANKVAETDRIQNVSSSGAATLLCIAETDSIGFDDCRQRFKWTIFKRVGSSNA